MMIFTKKLTVLLSICCLLLACASTKTKMDKGDYDAVIWSIAERIQKHKRVTDEEIRRLADAYQMANDKDQSRIQTLKQSGYDDHWPAIFDIYNRIHNRQKVIFGITPVNYSNGEPAEFATFNYAAVMEEARENAATFYYDRGLAALKTGKKSDARQAWNEFNKVLNYYKDYKDINTLIQQAADLGTSHVLVMVDRRPGLFLPPDFETELLNADYSKVAGNWVQLYFDPAARSAFDFAIKMVVTGSVITPGTIRETFCDDVKEIEDGWKYQYDSKGNVMKDSSGNDIKIPVYLRISAHIKETQMNKAAAITGDVQFYDYARKNLIKSVPARGDAVFNYYFAQYTGDKRALSEESKRKLYNQPMPFPSDPEILLTATRELKRMISRIIHDNDKIFLNYYE